MLKRIVVLFIVLGIYGVVLGSAIELLPLVDQYYNNNSQFTDLNMTKIRLDSEVTELNKSLIESEEEIKKIDNNIKIFHSEIDSLEMTIQENIIKKNETERNIRIINALNNKESIFLLGTLLGTIAGLWIVSLALVLLWRR